MSGEQLSQRTKNLYDDLTRMLIERDCFKRALHLIVNREVGTPAAKLAAMTLNGMLETRKDMESYYDLSSL
jgi:hypothetical protein